VNRIRSIVTCTPVRLDDRLSKAKPSETLLPADHKKSRLKPPFTLRQCEPVDARLMKNDSASLARVDERLVEMQNG
jgi:hypothetical protein